MNQTQNQTQTPSDIQARPQDSLSDAAPPALAAALRKAAAAARPLEPAWRQAWDAPADQIDGALRERAAAINAALEPFVDEIARASHNATSTVREVFGPRHEYHVWFGAGDSPSEFLEKAALYGSFNPQYWDYQERKAARNAQRDAFLHRLFGLCGPQPADIVGATALLVDSAQGAAAAVGGGEVPVIAAKDRASFGEALLQRGLIEIYDKREFRAGSPSMEGLSPQQALSFVVVNHGPVGQTATFAHWPRRRAFSHVEAIAVSDLAAEVSAEVAPDGPANTSASNSTERQR